MNALMLRRQRLSGAKIQDHIKHWPRWETGDRLWHLISWLSVCGLLGRTIYGPFRITPDGAVRKKNLGNVDPKDIVIDSSYCAATQKVEYVLRHDGVTMDWVGDLSKD